MSLPDYTQAAINGLQDLNIGGSHVSGEPIYNIWSSRVCGNALPGDGVSAGVEAGTTVTMSGFPGRTDISDIYKLLKAFDLKKVTAVPV
jgi:hypothetical protein